MGLFLCACFGKSCGNQICSSVPLAHDVHYQSLPFIIYEITSLQGYARLFPERPTCPAMRGFFVMSQISQNEPIDRHTHVHAGCWPDIAVIFPKQVLEKLDYRCGHVS